MSEILAAALLLTMLGSKKPPPAIWLSHARAPQTQGTATAAPRPAWMAPGKFDFLGRHKNTQDDLNLIWWTPSVKAGFGQTGISKAYTRYAGAFVRPFSGKRRRGDLLIGNQYVWTPTTNSWELQGEYRFPKGIGAGAGLVRSSDDSANLQFAKISYRASGARVSYILEAQVQEAGRRTSPGAYAAVFNTSWMLAGGGDGEQWRTAVGFVSNRAQRRYSPSFEVLYADNRPGVLSGPRIIFANATLNMRGGFLTHGARLGRAMGPQGLEFGNPLGFLAPTWNRKLETWEFGSLVDVRFDQTRLPNGSKATVFDALAFPMELAGARRAWRNVFGGLSRTATRQSAANVLKQSTACVLMTGYYGSVGPLILSARVGYTLGRHDPVLGIGLLRLF